MEVIRKMVIEQKMEQEIHKRQLYITREVFDLCKKHGICCFLVGGSLLGAIKAQDIIEGDKDVDIGMLREDYEKFLKVANELPSDLSLLEPRIDLTYNWLFAKVCLKGTKLIPKETPLFGPITGIYVDINPYDYVSEDGKKRKVEYKSAKLKKWFLLMKGRPSKRSFKLTFIGLFSKIQRRERLIDYFVKGHQKTGVVQNIVGGTEKDWFTLEEINAQVLATLDGYHFSAPTYKRYLDSNYPGWQTEDMKRTELDKYEVEYD